MNSNYNVSAEDRPIKAAGTYNIDQDDGYTYDADGKDLIEDLSMKEVAAKDDNIMQDIYQGFKSFLDKSISKMKSTKEESKESM